MAPSGICNGIGATAILGGIGNERIGNFGVVTGNVFLGSGLNAFDNMQGGLFNSGTAVDLGAGNLLTNSGTLSPGGSGTVLTTALTGDLTQTASGQFLLDLQGPNADRIDVIGSADLDGRVRPNFTLAGIGASTQWTVLTTTGTLTDSGVSAVSTAVVTFDLIFPTPTQMDLVLLGVDFAAEGLNRNETSIGENFNKIYGANGSPGLNPVLEALAQLPTVGSLAGALDQLSPEIYLDTEIATLFSALSFTDKMMTCQVRDGANAFIQDGQCVWALVSGRSFEQDKTFQTFGIDETSFDIAAGAQFALGPVWRVGLSGGYDHGRLDVSTNATSDFDRANAGAVLKYNPGPLLLAAAVSGGWGWYDTERPIAFPGFSAFATSDSEIGYIDGRFRAAYLFSNGKWYAKPMVDFDATHISLDSVTERGAGGVGLNVRGNDETVLSATPALELGVQFGSPGGTLVRPYVRGGATFFDDPDFGLLASFQGAPGGIGPFRIATETDDVVGDVSAGVDVIATNGSSFSVYYDGRFGDTVEAHEGGVKGTLPF